MGYNKSHLEGSRGRAFVIQLHDMGHAAVAGPFYGHPNRVTMLNRYHNNAGISGKHSAAF